LFLFQSLFKQCRDARNNMPLTPEEIQQVTDAAATGTVPEFLQPVVKAGWGLQTAAQATAAQDAYKKQVIKDRDSELYTSFEGTIKEVSGLDKLPGEKATDYAKRVYSATTTELAELKTKQQDGAGLTAAEKERMKQLEKGLLDKDTELKTAKTSYEQQLLDYRKDNDVNAALAVITPKLRKDITGDLLQDVTTARLNQFNSLYKAETQKDDAGKDIIVYRDIAKNEVALNAQFKPAAATELLDKLFLPYVATDQNQPGGGSGPQGAGGKKAEVTKDTYAPSAQFKTKPELSDDIKRAGFAAGTPEFTELLNKYGKDLPLF
jgi:hypothetical protein